MAGVGPGSAVWLVEDGVPRLVEDGVPRLVEDGVPRLVEDGVPRCAPLPSSKFGALRGVAAREREVALSWRAW